MNRKSIFIKFAFVLLCLLMATVSVDAQKRRTTRRTAPKTNPAPTAPAPSADIKNGAEKVSIQIKNLTKFIYVLGGAASGIEDIDKQAKTGRVAKATIDKNNQYKQTVIQSIRNLRAGLADLEIEFRTKPALRTYLSYIQGIADMTGIAEEQAAGGKFTDSGKTLLLVIERLSDTLAALP
jgi:hypothetical protein